MQHADHLPAALRTRVHFGLAAIVTATVVLNAATPGDRPGFVRATVPVTPPAFAVENSACAMPDMLLARDKLHLELARRRDARGEAALVTTGVVVSRMMSSVNVTVGLEAVREAEVDDVREPFAASEGERPRIVAAIGTVGVVPPVAPEPTVVRNQDVLREAARSR